MLHTLNVSIPSPRQFTYPFCYDVDPLAEAASLELQRYIADADLMTLIGNFPLERLASAFEIEPSYEHVSAALAEVQAVRGA